MPAPHAALGLRAHSGWAALIAVAGDRRAIEVVERRRVELGDPAVAGPKQPYHEAEGKPLAMAQRIVERFSEEARRRALEALRTVLAQLQAREHHITGCGLLLASSKPLPDLASILASHALIHTADGKLFRDAIADAAEKCRISVLKVRERELSSRAAASLKISEEELQRRISQLGRSLGPPWTQDQKLAAGAAWMALAET